MSQLNGPLKIKIMTSDASFPFSGGLCDKWRSSHSLCLLKAWRHPGLVQGPFYRRTNRGGGDARGRVSSSHPAPVTRLNASASLPRAPGPPTLVLVLPVVAVDCNPGFSPGWCQFFVCFFKIIFIVFIINMCSSLK